MYIKYFRHAEVPHVQVEIYQDPQLIMHVFLEDLQIMFLSEETHLSKSLLPNLVNFFRE